MIIIVDRYSGGKNIAHLHPQFCCISVEMVCLKMFWSSAGEAQHAPMVYDINAKDLAAAMSGLRYFSHGDAADAIKK
eukprot:scaffold166720_cov47-Prasinocladus_malaysianus.AAC.1